MSRIRKIMLAIAATIAVAACLLLVAVLAVGGLAQASLWAGVVAALASVVAAGAAVWPLFSHSSKLLPSAGQGLMEGIIDRPTELNAVIAGLMRDSSGTVGITTGLYGAGGFGKTTLALMVCADRRIRHRFGPRIYSLTVGRDVRDPAAIAAKVNDVIKLVTGEDATFADPEIAGRRLGSLLDAGPRALLVLDDVWVPEQLAAFTLGGHRCARLVTTRVPSLLTGRGIAVRVDQMSPQQARSLLTSGLPSLDTAIIEGLLAVTGRWPLLLRLVNKILADYARVASDVSDVSAQGTVLLEQLRANGPAVVDNLIGDPRRELNLDQPQQRTLAVRATIGASTSLLNQEDAQLFAELGVFAEDEAIPFDLVTLLWGTTADVDSLRASQICQRLAELALVSTANEGVGGIALHDVVRDFLRYELGQRLAELNNILLDAVAESLPAASPLDTTIPAPHVAWWELSDRGRYMWDHLIEHMQDAGRHDDTDALAGDLRWVGARLKRFGPVGPAADFAKVTTARAARLQRVFGRAAHLLAPTEPPNAVIDILHSRVASDPDWKLQVTALRKLCAWPRLVNRWLPPDLTDTSLRRALTIGDGNLVETVAVAPDGSWLAFGDWDNTIRIWDTASWQERAILEGHRGTVNSVAVAPDGSWLASGSEDKTVRIWDTTSWQERAILKGHLSAVNAVAVAPSGSWLASGGVDFSVHIWDAASGQKRATLRNYRGFVNSVVIAPDGSWLAFSGSYGRVQIWDVATGRKRAIMKGRRDSVKALAVAPDGSWMASAGGWDGTVRIWDVASGQERAVLKGHRGTVNSVSVAPDGNWLASGGTDGTVRIWDVASRQERAIFKGHRKEVKAVAVAPDGSWVASLGGLHEMVRIWDVPTGHEQATLTGNAASMSVAGAPDGNWLASGGTDGTVRIQDVASGQELEVLEGPHGTVNSVSVASAGSWLASASTDSTVRIWDVGTGQERAVLKGHRGTVNSVVVAPNDSWLTSGGTDGRVRIWDAATGRKRIMLMRNRGIVNAVVVAPDSSWLAWGGIDNTVRIRNVRRFNLGRYLAIQWKRAVLKGHRSAVNAVAVAPDGSWLASGSEDGTVRIWDMATRRKRAILEGHRSAVNAVAVAPDGSWLASGSEDGTVRIWDMATRRTLALMRIDDAADACAWLNPKTLTVGGAAGVYLFDLLAGHLNTIGS